METTEDQKPNRPRVWDFCCDSRGNSSRTDMHTQAEQRPCEIEASCGLPMRFGQHSSSKIYGLAHCRPFVFGLLFDSSNSPACSCVSTTCLLHRKRVSQQCEAASCTSFRRWIFFLRGQSRGFWVEVFWQRPASTHRCGEAVIEVEPCCGHRAREVPV